MRDMARASYVWTTTDLANMLKALGLMGRLEPNPDRQAGFYVALGAIATAIDLAPSDVLPPRVFVCDEERRRLTP